MERYHPMKSLAPRDVVARAIDAELKRTGDDYVVLDMTHLDPQFLVERFPDIHAALHAASASTCATQPIPVVPGGALLVRRRRHRRQRAHQRAQPLRRRRGGHDRPARRLPPGLQLAARGLVFGRRAADDVRGAESLRPPQVAPWYAGRRHRLATRRSSITQNWDEVRRLMWNYVGIVRTDKRLERARRRIELIRDEIREYYWNFKVTSDLLELRNLALRRAPDHRVRAPPQGDPRPALQRRLPAQGRALRAATPMLRRGDGPRPGLAASRSETASRIATPLPRGTAMAVGQPRGGSRRGTRPGRRTPSTRTARRSRTAGGSRR